MGDTIVATPFLEQLHEQSPDARIVLLTSPTAADALAGCQFLEEIIAVDASAGGRLHNARELLRSLRRGAFDAVFLLNRSFHCAVMAAAAGIPVRVGYAIEYCGPLLTVRVPYRFDRNEADCHLDMLRALGLSARHRLPDLWITEAERAAAAEIVRSCAGSDGCMAPLVGVQPGANDAHIREWGAVRFAHVADALLDEFGGAVVLMGGEAERKTARRMAEAMRHRVVDLVGQLTLRQALAVIGVCDLWVGNDTGLLHAAVAQRIPSVGLFGPNKVARWGYDAQRHRSLASFPAEPARTDDALRACMDAITEESVLATLREVRSVTANRDPGCDDVRPGAQTPYFERPDPAKSAVAVRRR